MLLAAEAQQRICDKMSPLDALELATTEAHGCVLAETVAAPEDIPPRPSAAADGFALRSEDTASAAASAVSLGLVGEAAAGRPFAGHLARGEAVRVVTGATLPEGADAVALRDDVAVVGSSMAVGKPIRPGSNVRPAGEELSRGDPVMHEGQRIRGMDVGVLAALGRVRVTVRPRPRVVAFAVGEYLREPGEPLGDTGMRESTSFSISGMAREAGCEATRAAAVKEDLDAIHERFQSYLPQADVFVTAGASTGVQADGALRQAASRLGTMDVWQIASNPEMAVGVGEVQGRPLFALPRGAVVATLGFELLVRPALLKMAGRRTLSRPEVVASMQDGYKHVPGRESYLRVRAWQEASGWSARLVGRQGPSAIASVASANALAVVAPDRGGLEPGDEVRVILLEPLEGW